MYDAVRQMRMSGNLGGANYVQAALSANAYGGTSYGQRMAGMGDFAANWLPRAMSAGAEGVSPLDMPGMGLMPAQGSLMSPGTGLAAYGTGTGLKVLGEAMGGVANRWKIGAEARYTTSRALETVGNSERALDKIAEMGVHLPGMQSQYDALLESRSALGEGYDALSAAKAAGALPGIEAATEALAKARNSAEMGARLAGKTGMGRGAAWLGAQVTSWSAGIRTSVGGVRGGAMALKALGGLSKFGGGALRVLGGPELMAAQVLGGAVYDAGVDLNVWHGFDEATEGQADIDRVLQRTEGLHASALKRSLGEYGMVETDAEEQRGIFAERAAAQRRDGTSLWGALTNDLSHMMPWNDSYEEEYRARHGTTVREIIRDESGNRTVVTARDKLAKLARSHARLGDAKAAIRGMSTDDQAAYNKVLGDRSLNADSRQTAIANILGRSRGGHWYDAYSTAVVGSNAQLAAALVTGDAFGAMTFKSQGDLDAEFLRRATAGSDVFNKFTGAHAQDLLGVAPTLEKLLIDKKLGALGRGGTFDPATVEAALRKAGVGEEKAHLAATLGGQRMIFGRAQAGAEHSGTWDSDRIATHMSDSADVARWTGRHAATHAGFNASDYEELTGKGADYEAAKNSHKLGEWEDRVAQKYALKALNSTKSQQDKMTMAADWMATGNEAQKRAGALVLSGGSTEAAIERHKWSEKHRHGQAAVMDAVVGGASHMAQDRSMARYLEGKGGHYTQKQFQDLVSSIQQERVELFGDGVNTAEGVKDAENYATRVVNNRGNKEEARKLALDIHSHAGITKMPTSAKGTPRDGEIAGKTKEFVGALQDATKALKDMVPQMSMK